MARNSVVCHVERFLGVSLFSPIIFLPFYALASATFIDRADIFIDHRQLPNRALTIKDVDTSEPHPTRGPTIVPSRGVRACSKGQPAYIEINKDRSVARD